MQHELKTWPKLFEALLSGAKRFEVRKDDRSYKVGDTLRLREYRPDSDCYTGREVQARVTYLLREQWGLPVGLVVMSVELYA